MIQWTKIIWVNNQGRLINSFSKPSNSKKITGGGLADLSEKSNYTLHTTQYILNTTQHTLCTTHYTLHSIWVAWLLQNRWKRTEDRGQRTEDRWFQADLNFIFQLTPNGWSIIGCLFETYCEVEIVLVKLQTVNVSFEAWTWNLPPPLPQKRIKLVLHTIEEGGGSHKVVSRKLLRFVKKIGVLRKS